MTWNYRMVRLCEQGVITIAIYEVYYDDKNNPVSRTLEPSYPMGQEYIDLRETDNALDEFNKDLNCYIRATALPMLEEIDGKLVQVK